MNHSLNFIPFAIFGSLMGLFWLIVIFVLIYFFKKSRHHNHSHGSWRANSPENMLKERFVKGEISDEDYKRMKKTLSEDTSDNI